MLRRLSPFGIALLSLAPPVAAQVTTETRRVETFVAGEVLVCPMPGKASQAAAGVDAAGLRIVERDGLSGVLRVAVPVGQEDAWVELLPILNTVESAERNGTGQGGLVPNDTHYGAQWHLRNTGEFGGSVGADIEAEAAWELTTGSASIVIAVLDTGIDSDHPDFAGRIDPDGYDFVNEDGNPEADHPHGTWVSGCLGANANNAFATVGVDWNCRILPIKVLNRANRGTSFDLAQGLNYVAQQTDVRVICMSLINYPNTAVLRSALTNASNAGKILIACAGNGGRGNANRSFPGASPLTISIGATTRFDTRATFSGTGFRLDFVAPGDSITTTAHGTSANVFSVVSGCSFATPIASGVVGLALALADARGLELAQSDVYELLRAGAEDRVGRPGEDVSGRDDFHGHGRINAYRTLAAVPLVLPLDIRPGACVNPFQAKSRGVLPIALVGSGAADLRTIDLSSVRLARADGVGGEVAPSAGQPGPRSRFVDFVTHLGGSSGCYSRGPDGIVDLSMKFKSDDIAAKLRLDKLARGTSVELVVRGALTDGQEFVATDAIELVPLGPGPPQTSPATRSRRTIRLASGASAR